MKRRWIDDERGSVLIFTTLSLVFILIMGGIAIDLAFHSTVRGELQRSMDAAALAGAGRLGRPAFGDSAFPFVRTWAQNYANDSLNRSRVGTNNLVPGNITLGVWDPTKPREPVDLRFEQSTEGWRVNAVRCRYGYLNEVSVPTSFLRLLGLLNLPVSAEAVAVASPPLTLPPNTCSFPIGLSHCAFQVPGVGSATSSGCGKSVAFVASGTALAGNPLTAAWVDLGGAGPTMAQRAVPAVNNVASGASCAVTLSVADSPQLETSTPMAGAGAVMRGPVTAPNISLIQAFDEKYAASSDVTVTDDEGTTVYSGKAWVVYVPVFDTGTTCPPTTITGPKTIVGWTRFVIRGINDQGNCHGSVPDAAAACIPPIPRRVIHGYYDCTYFDAPYNPNPAPISALSTRLRLVR